MHVVAIASGTIPEPSPALRSLVDAAELVIAVDGGLRHCGALAVEPDLLVGDLDSAPADLVAAAEAAGTEVLAFPPDKDETDLELALSVAVQRGATSVNVIGLFGGRVDHEVANIGLIAAPTWEAAGCRVWSDDGRRSMWVVRDAVELSLDVGTTLSLVPWAGDARGVTSSGVRWPLDAATLPAGTPRGVSNVAVEDRQRISVEQGTLLVLVDRSEISAGR